MAEACWMISRCKNQTAISRRLQAVPTTTELRSRTTAKANLAPVTYRISAHMIGAGHDGMFRVGWTNLATLLTTEADANEGVGNLEICLFT
jgi:hypothetical protein